MEPSERRMEEAQLAGLSTGDLVRHALEESRLLVKAEVLHAKQELRDTAAAATVAGILFGSCIGLALSGLTLLFVALALAIPLAEPLAALLVGVGLLVIAGVLGAIGVKKLPTKPMARTQERLASDYRMAREELQ